MTWLMCYLYFKVLCEKTNTDETKRGICTDLWDSIASFYLTLVFVYYAAECRQAFSTRQSLRWTKNELYDKHFIQGWVIFSCLPSLSLSNSSYLSLHSAVSFSWQNIADRRSFCNDCSSGNAPTTEEILCHGSVRRSSQGWKHLWLHCPGHRRQRSQGRFFTEIVH